MPRSTVTSKGQTTVPKDVRDALDLEPGDKLTWEVRGGKVTITTERPAFYRWEGFIQRAATAGTASVLERSNSVDRSDARCSAAVAARDFLIPASGGARRTPG